MNLSLPNLLKEGTYSVNVCLWGTSNGVGLMFSFDLLVSGRMGMRGSDVYWYASVCEERTLKSVTDVVRIV